MFCSWTTIIVCKNKIVCWAEYTNDEIVFHAGADVDTHVLFCCSCCCCCSIWLCHRYKIVGGAVLSGRKNFPCEKCLAIHSLLLLLPLLVYHFCLKLGWCWYESLYHLRSHRCHYQYRHAAVASIISFFSHLDRIYTTETRVHNEQKTWKMVRHRLHCYCTITYYTLRLHINRNKIIWSIIHWWGIYMAYISKAYMHVIYDEFCEPNINLSKVWSLLCLACYEFSALPAVAVCMDTKFYMRIFLLLFNY